MNLTGREKLQSWIDELKQYYPVHERWWVELWELVDETVDEEIKQVIQKQNDR